MESYSVPSSPFDHYALAGETDSADSLHASNACKSAASSPYYSSRSLASLVSSMHSAHHSAAGAAPHAPFAAGSDGSSATSGGSPGSSSSESTVDAGSEGAANLSLPPSLSNSTSASAASTVSAFSHGSSSSAASSPPSSLQRLCRVKDKLKHSESENRRRTRLRHKFSLLRDAAGCSKKDRYTILTTAAGRINELQARLQQAEHDKASLLLSINNLTQPHHTQPHHSAPPQQQQQPMSTASLASPPGPFLSLADYPLLASVCTALVSVDGRLLDCNAAMCHATGWTRDELTQRTLFEVCDSAQLLDTVVAMKRLIEGRGDTWEARRALLHRAGHATDMATTMATVRHDGRVAAFLLLMVPASPTQQQLTDDGLDDGLPDALQSKMSEWQQHGATGGCIDEAIKREDGSLLHAHAHYDTPYSTDATRDGQQAQLFMGPSSDGSDGHTGQLLPPAHSILPPDLPASSMPPYHNAPVAALHDEAAAVEAAAIKHEADPPHLHTSSRPPSPATHATSRAAKRPHPYHSHSHSHGHAAMHSHERPSYDSSDGLADSAAMPPPHPPLPLQSSSHPLLSRRLPPTVSIQHSNYHYGQPGSAHRSPHGGASSAQSHTRHLSSSAAAPHWSHHLGLDRSVWGRPSLSAPNSPTLQQHARQLYQHTHSPGQYSHYDAQQPPWHSAADGAGGALNGMAQVASGGGSSGQGEDLSAVGGLEPAHASFHPFFNIPC